MASGCSAGEARCVRDAEVGGSNPLTPTNFFTKVVRPNTIIGNIQLEISEDSALTTVNLFGMAPRLRGVLCPNSKRDVEYNMKAAIWARVSITEQETENQLSNLEAWATAKNLEVVETYSINESAYAVHNEMR